MKKLPLLFLLAVFTLLLPFWGSTARASLNILIGNVAELNGDLMYGDDVVGDIAAGDFPGADSLITANAVSFLLEIADLSLGATNNIATYFSLGWNANNTLTLDAGNSIAINSAITNTGTGSFDLTSGAGGIVLGSPVSLSGGDLNLISTGTITQTGSGALTVGGTTFIDTGANAVTLAHTSNALTGAISLTSGTTSLTNSVATDVTLATTGNTTLTVTDSESLYVSGTVNANLTTSAGETTLGSLFVNGDLSLSSESDIIQDSSLTITGTTTLQSGALQVSAIIESAVLLISSGASVGGDGSIYGDLILNAGAGFDFIPGSTLTVMGDVSLDSTFGVDDLLGLDSSVDLGSYILINGTSTNFASLGIQNWGIANAYDLGDGKFAYFSQGSLTLEVIPEPSPIALFLSIGTLAFILCAVTAFQKKT